MENALAGKRVLITQADAFMGPVLCEVFAEQGAEVIASPHFSHPHGSAPGGAAFCFTRRRDREGSGPRAANRGLAGEVLQAVRCVEGASGAVRA